MKLSIICSSVFLFLLGCSSAVTSSALTQSDWQVDQIVVADSIVTIDGQEHPTLSFAADSLFGGQTMCNSISGTYHTTQNGGISMSIEASTTTFCPDNTIEGILIEQIGLTHYYSMAGENMLFKDADGRTIVKLSPISRKINN